jgi:CelD/BcsL family acetyltransferase involved in cellulose biosynthesis
MSVLKSNMPTRIDATTEYTCALQPMDDALEQEWDRLALRCEATPYMRPGWFRAWMNAFRPRQPLSLLTVRRAGDLVAALPLVNTRLGLRPPVNSETPSFEPLSVDAEAARALVGPLLTHCRHIDLSFVPAGGNERDLVRSAEDRGCRVRRDVVRRSPYTRVDDDWEILRNEVLGRSRRKWMARSRRQLGEMGDLTFEVHDSRSPLRDLLDEGLAMEAAGWKGTRGTAILSRPSTAAFYKLLAEWAAAAGLLRLHFLRLDGRPIAFEFALEQSGALHVLKTAYDEEMRRYGPGILILDEGLAYASKQPHLHVSESLGEDDPYKLEFSTGVHEQLRISVFSNDVIGTAAWAWQHAVDRSQAQLRRHLPDSTRQRLVRLAQFADRKR